MTSSFAVLRLPHNAIKVLFGELCKSDFDSIIAFSTCSTKTKLLVKSIKLKVHCIKVDLSDQFSISFSYSNKLKYSVLNPTRSTDLETLTPCQLSSPRRLTFISMPSVRDLLDHFMCIFNRSSIDIEFSSHDMWTYTLESISRLLRGLNIRFLEIDDVEEENITFEILGFFPVMATLFMGQFDEREEPDVSEANLNQLKKIVIGNITVICLRQNIPLDLNTLLMMNGIEINLSSPRLTDREFNMFLKLWIKGSNPRLEMLHCFYPDDGIRQFAECIILKGIQYKKQPTHLQRKFQPNNDKPNVSMRLVGGYDIRRKDQTTATVSFRSNHFSMHVWSSNNTYTADGSLS